MQLTYNDIESFFEHEGLECLNENQEMARNVKQLPRISFMDFPLYISIEQEELHTFHEVTDELLHKGKPQESLEFINNYIKSEE
mgnify:CR=1 FL=1